MNNTAVFSWIGRLIAIFALLSFLFMPQFSCGAHQVNGYSIVAKTGLMMEGHNDAVLSSLSWGIIAAAVIGILFAGGGYTVAGLVGIICSVALIFYIKSKVSEDPMASGVINFEPGAFLTIIAFIVLFILGIVQPRRRYDNVKDTAGKENQFP